MMHCEIGTESTWEAFVLECNKNKDNINPFSSDIEQQPVSRRRDIKSLNDDSRDDSPTRRESLQQYSSSTNVPSSKSSIDCISKKKASPTSVRTKLNSSGGGSNKKKNRRQAEWLDRSTDYSSSSSHTNKSSDNSVDNNSNIDPNELVNQLNQIYIDQLLDVSEEKQNESLNLSIEIDDNDLLYLSPQQSTPQTKPTDKGTDNTSLLEITNDITLTPTTSYLQLDIGSNSNLEMNVLECSEITLDSSFLTELDDMTAVDMSISSRLDVSDNMSSDEFEIVMNEHQNITREVTAGALDEVSNESIDTSINEPIANVQHHTLNDSTITCDEFITEAIQTSFIENVKLGYNVVTNKLEKEFIDMGFADCISG